MGTGSKILDDLLKDEAHIEREISERETILRRLREQIDVLTIELAYLKDWIWTSDDENIIELREELLTAAKIVVDQKQLSDHVEEQKSERERASIYDVDDIPF